MQKQKTALKFIWDFKELWKPKTILRKKKKVWGLTTPDFKTYYEATVIKIVWYWHKDKHRDQWNRIQNPGGKNSQTYSRTIFNQGARTTQLGKDNLFNKWCWQNWILTCKRIMLDLTIHHIQKSTWNKT